MVGIALGLAVALLVVVAVSLAAPARAQQGGLLAPVNLQVADGDSPGAVAVSWDGVEDAAFYRIGWVASDRIAAALAAGRDWQDAFAFADVANRGQTAHRLTDLAPGGRYAFIIGSIDVRYGAARWSEWAYLTLAEAPATSCPTDGGGPAATPTPMPTPTPGATPGPGGTPAPMPTPAAPATLAPTPTSTPTLRPTPTGTGDYDADKDGLIEVANLAQLAAIRYDLNGNGVSPASAYAVAFPDAVPGMGCPGAGCTGYELVADLDFDTNSNGEVDAGDAYWNDGAGWVPIGDEAHKFTADFDGNNHTIANLYINRSETSYVGLFGVALGSSIKQVGLASATVSGGYLVGGLVGYSEGSIISDSYAMVSVSGSGEYIGGLLGMVNTEGNTNSIISDSYAMGSVSGDDYVGGLVGYNSSGAISGSYATGAVSGGDYVGGLVGYESGDSDSGNISISDSYATGSVSGGDDYVGGLAGYSDHGNISGSYATGKVSGDFNVGGLVGHIDSSTINSSYATGSVAGAFVAGGLVGYTDSGIIGDSYAAGSVSGDGEYFGGLVGYSYGSTISASYATGSVSGYDNVGGLVGHTGSSTMRIIGDNTITNSDIDGNIRVGASGTISASYATGNVTGDDYLGGLVGSGYGTIRTSYAAGNVSGSSDYSHYVGGLVGYIYGGAVSGSYAIGSVAGSYHVGGLVGYNSSGAISDSYAAGSVAGKGYDIGGLVGRNEGGAITASYAIGSVSTSGDTFYTGGLVGYDDDGGIIASYWDTQTTGQAGSYGGVGKTTAELQFPTDATGIYADWDAEHWDFGNPAQYPVLKYGGLDVAAQRR